MEEAGGRVGGGAGGGGGKVGGAEGALFVRLRCLSHDPLASLQTFPPGLTPLYCTVLYSTVLYSTVLYCTVLYCTVECPRKHPL